MLAFAKHQPSPSEIHVGQAMELLLGESPSKAMEYATQCVQRREASRHRWATLAKANQSRLLRRLDELQAPSLPRLAAFLNQHCKMGTVFATIHMGDYMYAIGKILQRLDRRRVLIVQHKDENEIEIAALRKIPDLGHELDVVRTTETSAAADIRQNLMQGAVIVTFFDLPKRFGNAEPVRFFGRDVWWVRGPAEYAALAESLLVPFVSHEDNHDHIVALHPVIRATKDMEIGGLMSHLSGIAEQHIRSHPGQWLHWNLLPEMLNPDD